MSLRWQPWKLSVLLLCALLCNDGSALADAVSTSRRSGGPIWALEGLELLECPTRHSASATKGSAVRRSLSATETQRKCIWFPLSVSNRNDGTCGLNDLFILTLWGSPPSVSARILAYLQYKNSVCASYRSTAACFANPSDACGWDRGGDGSCYLSASAAYDPEVLRGRLYCDGSLLDQAARCALAGAGAGGASASGGGSGSCSSVVAAGGADCVFLSAAQLSTTGGGGQQLSTAALSYLRLVGLVTYTETDPEAVAEAGGAGSGAGLCVASWLLQTDRVEGLRRAAAANPLYGLLQPDLTGTCNGTEGLAKALAAAAATCAAATAGVVAPANGGDDPRRAACVAAAGGCRWDAAAGTCEPGYDSLYDALFDRNDPWVRAVSDASRHCAAAAASRAACDAAASSSPPLDVDPSRITDLRLALSNPDWILDGGSGGGGGGNQQDGGGGGGGGAGSKPTTSWFMVAVGAAAAALLGRAGAGAGVDGVRGVGGGGGTIK